MNHEKEAPKAILPTQAAVQNICLKDIVSDGIATELYVDFNKIGEGHVSALAFSHLHSAAGEVFLATSTKTGEKVAVKQMPINADNMKLLVTEISIMKSSLHKNIVQFYDAFIIENSQLWAVMELMDGGCLTDVLEQFDAVKMTEGQIAFVCREVCICRLVWK